MSGDLATFCIVVILAALMVLASAGGNPFLAVVCLIGAGAYLAWSASRWADRMRKNGRW